MQTLDSKGLIRGKVAYYNLDGTGTVDHVAMYVGSGPYGNQTVIQAPYSPLTVQYVALYTNGLVAAGRP